MKRIIMIVVMAAAAGHAAAGPVLTETAVNPHHFTLKLDQYNFDNGGWSGDAEFAISACPEESCFHLSGWVHLPINPATGVNEGSFSIPQVPCDLHFQEVPRQGMDSGDYRITLISRTPARTGCASLPAGLAGVYREVPALSGKYRGK